MDRLRIGSPSLRQAHNVITLTSFLWLFFSRVGFLPLYLQVYSHIALTDKKAENFRAFNLNSVGKKGSVTRTQYFHSKYFPKLSTRTRQSYIGRERGIQGPITGWERKCRALNIFRTKVQFFWSSSNNVTFFFSCTVSDPDTGPD